MEIASPVAASSAACDADIAAKWIAVRRLLLDWRDRWSIEAELRLRAVSNARADDLAAHINGLSHKELALARTGYAPLPILGEIVDEVAMAADSILADAEASLAAIVVHHLNVEARAAADAARGGLDADELVAIGKSVAPIAAAAGLGLALPGLATTTSVALFGLVTTTTVSVPILTVGIGGIVALSALGVVSLSGMRDSQERRLRDAIYRELEARLFAPAENGQEPSLLARLEAGFALAANQLIGNRP